MVQRTILIIDDREYDRMMHRRALAGTDYRIEEADSISTGLASAASCQPDVILLDFRLEGESGIDFLQQQASSEDVEQPAVIMLTGCGNELVAVEAMKSGASDYLIKDISGGHLKLLPITVDKALRERDARCEKRQNNAELAVYRQRLEDLVVERTRELVQAQKAAEIANVAKSTFLANMSHEMRTPLHQVVGMAQMIRREGLTPRQEERMSLLEKASNRLNDLIDAILRLTDIEANRIKLEFQPIDVRQVVSSVVAKIQNRAAEKQIRLVSNVDDICARLQGDPSLIETALLCYGNNAITFTDSGQVSLCAKIIAEDAESAVLRLEVADTGVGIPPEAMPRLFTMFEQVDNSATRKYGGTGLGLAMTKKTRPSFGRRRWLREHTRHWQHLLDHRSITQNVT